MDLENGFRKSALRHCDFFAIFFDKILFFLIIRRIFASR